MGSADTAGGIVSAFLFAFPALFAIVNPLGAALIFSQVMADRTPEMRHVLARKVAVYSFGVLLCSLWAGTYILNFFGITIGALRAAGGLVVAIRAWSLLMAPEVQESKKEQQAAPASSEDDVAFFPLTMPFTTGPGTIAVAITLGSTRPAHDAGFWLFFIGVSAAAALIAAIIWIAYNSADALVRLLGGNVTRVVTRLAAFLLLCIGVQILATGVQDLLVAALQPLLRAPA